MVSHSKGMQAVSGKTHVRCSLFLCRSGHQVFPASSVGVVIAFAWTLDVVCKTALGGPLVIHYPLVFGWFVLGLCVCDLDLCV